MLRIKRAVLHRRPTDYGGQVGKNGILDISKMFCGSEAKFKILRANFYKKKERTHICTPREVLVYLRKNAEEAPQVGRHSGIVSYA